MIEYQKHVENIQILEFLASLNYEFEQVQGLILAKDPSPSLNEVYVHVHREERHHGVMNLSPIFKKYALIFTSIKGSKGKNSWHGRGGRSMPSSEDMDKLKCEHCGQYRHTKEQCWELHGHPHDLPTRGFQRGGSSSNMGGGQFSGNCMTANLASSTNTEVVFNSSTSMPLGPVEGSLFREEIEALFRFVSQLDHSSIGPTSSFAYSGTSTSALLASTSSPSCT